MVAGLPDLIGEGRYRTLLPWEHARYAAHLLRLSPKDRRTRFLGSVSDDFIRSHARKRLISPRAKVIGWFHDGMLRGGVELGWGDDRIAEAAFSVEELHRKQGIGTGLARRALRAARNRGIASLVILTEADNVSMRRLGARFGATFDTDKREIEGTIATGDASILSIILEAAEEQSGFAATAQPLWMAEA